MTSPLNRSWLSICKRILAYTVAFCVVTLFLEVAWPFTMGSVIGVHVARHPELQNQLSTEGSQQELPHSVRQLVYERVFSKIRWFWVTMFASLVIYSISGFLCGLLIGDWIFVGLLPLGGLLINNPLVRFPPFGPLPLAEQLLTFFIGQVASSTLGAYFGVRLKRAKATGASRSC